MIRHGKWRGEKIEYPDGIGCCIWLPFDEYEDSGHAFDFSFEDIDDMIATLNKIKAADAELFEDD